MLNEHPAGSTIPTATYSSVASVLPALLEECSNAFKRARSNVFEGAALLYQIKLNNAWEGCFSSFSEFVEAELGISNGHASKLCAIYEHYIVNGNSSHAKISEAEPEKLYLAMRLKIPIEHQIVHATLLTRKDLKAELAVNSDGSEHECVAISFCKTCNRRM